MALDVESQFVGSFVTAGAVLFEALEDDAIEIAVDFGFEVLDLRFEMPPTHVGSNKGAGDTGGRAFGFFFANDALHPGVTGAAEPFFGEWSGVGEEFVKEYAEGIDVAAG